MADERNRRQLERCNLSPVQIVNVPAARPWLNRLEEHVFALRQLGPNSLCVWRWLLHHRGAANTGMIPGHHREYFNAADVLPLQDAIGWPNIRKDASLAGRHDHQLKIFSAFAVNSMGERCSEVHLCHAGAYRTERVGDCLVGNARQSAEQLNLVRRFDLPEPCEKSLDRLESRSR